eukprot:2422017-Lingulodinium_polyedra.AAC.1
MKVVGRVNKECAQIFKDKYLEESEERAANRLEEKLQEEAAVAAAEAAQGPPTPEERPMPSRIVRAPQLPIFGQDFYM